MEECPTCGQKTLLQIAEADICQNQNCGYYQGYGHWGKVSSDE